MYKIMHLPTATFVKCKSSKEGWIDWEFVSLDSAKKVMSWKIVVDYDKDFVCLQECIWMENPGKVLSDYLDIIEVEDDG